MRSREDILTDLSIAGIKAGDRRSFTLLYRLWNPLLTRFASRLTHSQEATADVMQESWLAMSKGIGRLQNSSKFKSWAYRIVSNKCRDWIRSEQARRRLNESEMLESELNTAVNERDPANVIRESLGRLSEDQRIVITLFYLEEFNVRDISAALGVPGGTVKSRLYNARRTLKSVLENQNNE